MVGCEEASELGSGKRKEEWEEAPQDVQLTKLSLCSNTRPKVSMLEAFRCFGYTLSCSASTHA